jgi:hypothetical protein
MLYRNFDTKELFTKKEVEDLYLWLEDELEGKYEDFDEYLDDLLAQGRAGTGGLVEVPQYTVHWVAGDRDGETLYETDDYNEAINKARELEAENEGEFDPVCGGIGIVDNETDEDVEW